MTTDIFDSRCQPLDIVAMQLSVPDSVPLLTLHEFADRLHGWLSVLAESVRSPEPFMVDRAGAARFCGMSVATYDKYVRKKLLPGMNATGRVSLEALKRACLKLDGIAERGGPADDAERELRKWERESA